MQIHNLSITVIVSMASIAVTGCRLMPPGAADEQARVDQAGRPYEQAIERRQLPELPAEPSWRDVLHRAFLANGDLEAAYFEWQAAMHRVGMAAGWPNTNVSVGFEYMFSRERMKAWDRTTISVGFDPMSNLSLPMKIRQAAKVALDEARAAGSRFEAGKFDLQRKVLSGYLDYALLAEKVRIQRDNTSLLKLLVDTAESRVKGGAPQQDLLKAQIEYRMAENDLATMESELLTMRAMLNGMLARPADAPLPPPASLPEPRKVVADDARLILVATDLNPELMALARTVEGRTDALSLARMRYIPDINPMAGLTGDMTKVLGAMVSLPTTIPMIRGQIDESRAMLQAAQAMARQTKADRAASFVAALYGMRNAERQWQLFRDVILPKAQQVLGSSQQAYSAGAVGFMELIDSQRTLLQVRLLIAEAAIVREKRLADMEALAGVDIETLGAPATTQPEH